MDKPALSGRRHHRCGGSGEWLDLPAAEVDVAFHGSSAVAINLDWGIKWVRVRAASCAGSSEWSQIEELYVNGASDWEGVPVPEVEEGDEIEPCSEDADTSDNSPATGAPAISGTQQVGETLTANTSGVADADGLSNVQYEYQWLADDSDISGATNATFTDDAAHDETLTKAKPDTSMVESADFQPYPGGPREGSNNDKGIRAKHDTEGLGSKVRQRNRLVPSFLGKERPWHSWAQN